ncbi:MAG: hypothetical protein WA996_24935 [Candidatus Promineifilaceae bacterium]
MRKDLVTRLEVIFSLILAVLGLVLSMISLGAEIVGLDLTPGFGMVQMFQLLIGLTLLTIAGYLRIHSLRSSDTARSLQADIGIRLGATGLVFAYVSGVSDLIGIGTHVDPSFDRPFVGPIQLGGFLIGVLIITAGLLLYMTSRGSRQTSSLESLLKNDKA